MTLTIKRVGQGLAVALVAGLLALLVWRMVFGTGGPRQFTLPRLDTAGELSLESLRGKVVVVNFWASWCLPCKKEAPLLEKAWRRYRGQDVVVLGVDVNDFASDARKFMRRYRLSYPVVRDGSGDTVDPWGVTGFPETFFLDRQGEVVVHEVGEVEADELDAGIRRALEA